ncbi:MAG: hypothetical protein DRN10_01225 [Thermoplasmata archaeon]|nr:MAG: hypothetical protein DRN10_01225 [Thermoplasmata archaeon]
MPKNYLKLNISKYEKAICIYKTRLVKSMATKGINEEITEIKFLLEKIEGIINSRLIGEDEPEEDEIKEIKNYKRKKAEGKIELHEI